MELYTLARLMLPLLDLQPLNNDKTADSPDTRCCTITYELPKSRRHNYPFLTF